MLNTKPIFEFMVKNDLTSAELAYMCDISVLMLNRLIVGTERLWVGKTVRIARVVGVAFEELTFAYLVKPS